LKKQDEIRNALLHVESFHSSQERSRLIYRTIGEDKYADIFKATKSQVNSLIDSVTYKLLSIKDLDSTVMEGSEHDPVFTALKNTVDSSIIRSNSIYNSAFIKRASIKKPKDKIKIQQLDSITDTADANLKMGLIVADSLLTIQTKTRIKEIERRIDNVKDFTQLVLLTMSIFAIGFAFLFSRYISNSLRRLKESTTLIAKGNFNFDPRGYPGDEIGDLAKAFFDMAYDLKKAQEELIKKRRLAAIGEIVASVNHEINNPLMIISGNAQFLELSIDKGVTKDIKERIHAILEEAERISQVTKKLRDIKDPVVEDYTSTGEQMINIDKSSDS
jgi:signal transduction histidine kinase